MTTELRNIIYTVRYEALAEVAVEITDTWNMTPCIIIDRY
jgi:hypothetical protein